MDFNGRVEYSDGKLFWSDSLENKGFCGKPCGGVNFGGYMTLRVYGKSYYAHRVIYQMFHGDIDGKCIDHIDGDRLNNNIDNLRVVTKSENNKNSSLCKRNKTGVLGVHYDKGTSKFRVQISLKGKTRHIGVYSDFDEAVKARKDAECEFGFHVNHGKEAKV